MNAGICLISLLLLLPCALASVTSAGKDKSDDSASVVIVLDTSDEASSILKTSKKAATRFANRFSSDDELAVFASSGKPALVQPFTSDDQVLRHALNNLHPSGKPAIYETVAQAVEYTRSDAVNDNHAVVVYTNEIDGTRTSPMPALENTIRRGPPIPVYFIALGHSGWQSQEWLQRLAVLSGGAAYFAANNSEVTAVSQAIASRLTVSPKGDSVTSASHPDLRDYRTLLVRSIPVANSRKTVQFPSGDNALLERLLAARLQQARLFPEIIDAPESSNRAAALRPGADSELELLATVVGYDRGHPGTPFGPTKLRVQVVLRDLATGHPITAFTKQQSGPSGMFRGSEEKVEAQIIIGMANKIVEAIQYLKQRSSQ